MLSINAEREKLQDPSKPTLFTPSLKTPVFVCEMPTPDIGAMIFISRRLLRISHVRHSKKCMSRSERIFFNFSMSAMSKNGIGVSSSPLAIAILSCSVRISFIIRFILPPL